MRHSLSDSSAYPYYYCTMTWNIKHCYHPWRPSIIYLCFKDYLPSKFMLRNNFLLCVICIIMALHINGKTKHPFEYEYVKVISINFGISKFVLNCNIPAVSILCQIMKSAESNGILHGDVLYLFTEFSMTCPQSSLVPLNMCRSRSAPETHKITSFWTLQPSVPIRIQYWTRYVNYARSHSTWFLNLYAMNLCLKLVISFQHVLPQYVLTVTQREIKSSEWNLRFSRW